MPQGVRFVGFDRFNIWIISFGMVTSCALTQQSLHPNGSPIKTEFPEILYKIMQ